MSIICEGCDSAETFLYNVIEERGEFFLCGECYKHHVADKIMYSKELEIPPDENFLDNLRKISK